MTEILTRVWDDLVGRITGPFSFRLILQPMVAIILAIRAGLRDARAGRPPHAWAIVTEPARRRELLKESWNDVTKVFIVAVLIDIVYEIIVFRRIYPGESLIIAAVVALIPYLLIRGPANRLVCWWLHRREGPHGGLHRPHFHN
jgi:hypothetical protein